MTIKTIKLNIAGMTCDHCAKSIEKRLDKSGILKKEVSYSKHSGIVTFDEQKISADAIIQSINDTGHYKVINNQEIPSVEGSEGKHLLIIGGGSAAFAATLQASELGAKVTMINDGLPIGGTCVNVGCVPSKILLRAAHDLHQARTSHFAGISKSADLTDFKQLIAQKKKMVQQLQKQKYIDVVKDLTNFNLIEGRAKIISKNQVEVKGQTINGDAILVATGASPAVPPIPGLDNVPYLTNVNLYDLETLPEHLIILGGNYIGLEAAQMFARFGSKVTVLELLPQILSTESQDIVQEIEKQLKKEGIEILTEARTNSVQSKGEKVILHTVIGGKEKQITGSHLLLATGRHGNTKNLFAPEVNVETTTNGFVKVDDHLQTNVPGIFAAGDVTGKHMFVYTAAMEGKIAALNALSEQKQSVDYSIVPWVMFTDPQVAGVGLDETQARVQGYDSESATLQIEHIPRFIVACESRGFIKLIRDRSTDRLLGARIVAPEGAELLMEIAVGMKFGITVSQLRDMLHPYLTAAEGVKLTAITFTKNVDQLSCCAT